jgi:beta-galactosidase
MYLGVDYYPEQWQHLGDDMMAQDMARIKQTGGNMIRIGEFAWHLMEPADGQFDFSFFDLVIQTAKAHDLKVMFGTPTATFPAWLAKAHPSILAQKLHGHAHAFGGRRQYCFNSKVYQQYSQRMVTALVAHYADEPAIVAWQIDNELGHEGSDQCYCAQCHQAFQVFLSDKFAGDIQALNQTYGTIFWGQTYNQFDEIPMPTPTITVHNPALRLDWARFRSASLNRFAIAQIDLVQSLRGSHQPVTHNFFGGFFNVACDQNELAAHLDFVSYDNYPVWGGLTEPIAPAQIAMTLDYVRGLKQQNFWIVEALMGAQGHNHIGYLPRPNQAKMWAYQAMARGCDNLLFFRWRGMDRGAEQFCLGVLDVDNQDNRKLAEVRDFMRDIVQHEAALKTPVVADVAVLYDFDNIQSWHVQQQSSAFDFTQELMRLYAPFHAANVMTDVLSVHKDFSTYKIVVVPALQIIDGELAARLQAYVAQGGVLVMGYRAGIKNRDNNLHFGVSAPAFLTQLLGVTVRESEALGVGQSAPVFDVLTGEVSQAQVWRDMVEPCGANVLAHYSDVMYRDKACVTEHAVGLGWAYYVGAGLTAHVLQSLTDVVLTKAGLSSNAQAGGVEQVVRGNAPFTRFLLNHQGQDAVVNGAALAAYGVRVELE